jgi:hypothetical protein
MTASVVGGGGGGTQHQNVKIPEFQNDKIAFVLTRIRTYEYIMQKV